MSTTITSPEHHTVLGRLKQFITVFDERFEDYNKQPRHLLLLRDVLAGLVVALVAIPLGIGFAIASGLRPEQGIIAGAIACILGGLFGGSKYQVYGPTAAFITIVAGIVAQYDVPFLLLATVISGAIIMLTGIFGWGRFFKYVPHSVIVGFTMGIAATIIVTQLPDALGALHLKTSHHTIDKIKLLPQLFQDAHGHAIVLAALTFMIIRYSYKISVYIPGPIIALVVGAFVANNIWHDNLIPLIASKYGNMSEDLFRITLPSLGDHSPLALVSPVIAIVFIAALESLLSSRMADRLAGNTTHYNPDKELFGQGLVNIVVPLLNGFPCTGALARTATSIKVGAVSPAAAIIKGGFVILLMALFASQLSILPMACVSGLLIFVGANMVKPTEVQSVWLEGKFPTMVMLYTAIMTVFTDLLVAVATATVLYYVGSRLFRKPAAVFEEPAHVCDPEREPLNC